MFNDMNGGMSSAVSTVKSSLPSVDIEVAEVLYYLIKGKVMVVGGLVWWCCLEEKKNK